MSNEIESNQNVNIEEPTEKIKDIDDKKRKFNLANLPIIVILISIILFMVFRILGDILLSYNSAIAFLVSLLSLFIAGLSMLVYVISTFVSFFAIFFQVRNKNKTIADKIFLTINILFFLFLFLYNRFSEKSTIY